MVGRDGLRLLHPKSEVIDRRQDRLSHCTHNIGAAIFRRVLEPVNRMSRGWKSPRFDMLGQTLSSKEASMKLLGSVLLLIGMSSAAFAQIAPVPEISALTGVNAVCLIAGAVVVMRGRRKR